MKTVDFSETIAASDLRGSRRRHLIEYMKICKYRRSRSFLDLGPRSCTYKIQTGFSQKLLCQFTAMSNLITYVFLGKK